MLTAQDARTLTEASIEKMAKEFIANCVQTKVQDATDDGHYFCSASLYCIDNNISNPKAVGPEVVKQLEKLGYKATFTYCDNGPRVEAYVTIDWKPED